MDRMVLYPVHPLILKIVWWAGRSGCFAQGPFFFAALQAKKCHTPLSEHDLKDLWDGQDGVVSCTSFNL